MTTVRLLPPPGAASTTTSVNSRTYAAALGSYVDAPDSDAQVLAANGWTPIGPVGASSNRPVHNPNRCGDLVRGQAYLDVSLGCMVVYDGVTWRNPSTGAAV